MNIWIDADTGTYGIADDVYLLRVNDNVPLGDVLDALTDREVGTLARAFGHKIVDDINDFIK